jgi:hypothetical protein
MKSRRANVTRKEGDWLIQALNIYWQKQSPVELPRSEPASAEFVKRCCAMAQRVVAEERTRALRSRN